MLLCPKETAHHSWYNLIATCDIFDERCLCLSVRRVLTEWLQDEAAEKGLAAAATSGAGALVEAAAASAQLEVTSDGKA
jgi:hypothetical protein